MKKPEITGVALNIISTLPLPYALRPKAFKTVREEGGGVPTPAKENKESAPKQEGGDQSTD